MTRWIRIASVALLLAVGFIGGALLKQRTRAPETDVRAAQRDSKAVVAERVAAPWLPSLVSRVHEPRYAPRDPAEWQGMLVDLSMQASCESSHQCGLAMACHDGQCGPCTRDGECASGEGCVLDHCVVNSAIACRSRRDCASNSVCVLSGYSSDARGNGHMTAKCLAAFGGTEQSPEKIVPREDVPADRTPVRADDLMRELKKEVRR